MQTKNQIPLTRKSFYVIMLLAIFLSAFGEANLPIAKAQSTDKNIILIGGTVQSSPEIDAAAIEALETTNAPLPEAQYYTITDITTLSDWRFISTLGLTNVDENLDWNIEDNSVWAGLVLLKYQNDAWAGSVEGSEEFTLMINEIPDDILSPNAKSDLDPLQRELQAQANYHFPWASGTSMKYGSEGVHDNGFNAVASGWKAVDLLSGYGSSGEASNDLRAAAAGTVSYKCTPTNGGVTTAIKINDLFYTHLNNNASIYVGRSYGDGESIGSMKTGNFSENCGYASQGPSTFHVHLGFPNTGTITFDSWTLNMSTGLWSNGSTTLGIGSWLQAGGSGPNPCNPNSDQIAFYSDANYSGSCVIKGVGNYPDPGSMGIANDSVSSIKVGGNVKLTLYGDNNYVSTSETFTNDDSNLSGNTIGDNSASSAIVEPRSSGTSCSYNANQIVIFADPNYSGSCAVKGIGNYPDPGSMGISNDTLTSIRVGGNVKLILCGDNNYVSTCETFTGDDDNLSNNSIGNDQASSMKVESRSNSLPSDYGLCATEGQTCSFSGTAQIYYGANNQFVGPVTKTDGVACNNDVFGDPISGTQKQCFIKGGRPQGSTFCANEGGTCSFSGSVATVYFGANGKYATHTGVVSSTACNIATFGDPFSGVGKSCYYVVTGSSISTPSNPNPADNTTFARTNNTTLSWTTNGTSCAIHIWGGSIDISPSNGCGSLALGNQRGGAYNWQVTASNGGSATGPIWHFNIKPYAPTSLTTSGASASQVTLNWTLSSDEPNDVDTYEIYQDGQYIGYVVKGVSTYTVTGLTCSSSYAFDVKSKRQGVLSDASNTVTRGAVGCSPSAPSNLIVSNTTQNSITLNWQDNSSNESGFKVYRWGADANGTWGFYYYASVGVNGTSYTNTSLDCGADYFYEVAAYNGNGESSHIGWVKGTTSACPQPDLTVTDIRIFPSSPFTNDDVWVEVDIENVSNVAASGFWTDFYIDDTPTGCDDWGPYYGWSDGLAANATFTWVTRIQANSLTTGSHQFRAFVDSGCAAIESNENNNISTATAFTLTTPPTAAPSHDDFNSARLVSSIPYTNSVNVSGATTALDDPTAPNCGGYIMDPGMSSVWYKYTPSVNTTLKFDSVGSDYDTYIVVWSGSRGSLTQIACNDDSGGGYQSSLTASLSAGTPYYIEVAEYSSRTLASASLSAAGLPSRPGTIIEELAPKQPAEASSLSGGQLVFHATLITNTSIGVSIGTSSMGNYTLEPGTSQVLKYLVDGGPVVIGSDNGVGIVASLNQWRRNAAQPEGWFTGVAQSMALPVEQITNRYVMPRYNGTNPTLYDAVLMANVDTVPRTITVTIGGTVMGTYPLNPSQSVYATYPIVGGPIVVSSVTGARIVASLYELKRSQAGVPWNGQSEMMGLPSGQLSDKYLLPIYFGAANPATLDARLYFANVDTVATTVEVKIAGVSRGTYLMQPSTSMEVKYLVDGGPVEISSNNGAKIVASLNQWRRNAAEPVEWFTGVAQSMALPVELITDKYVIPRYNGTDPTLYDAVLMANVDSVPRTITVKIGATVMGTYPLNPSQSVYATYPIADGPIIVSSDVGAKIVASLYELKRYQAGVPWNGQSEMMGLPFGQLSDQYLLPIYFGAANPLTLDARLYIAVP